MKKSTVTLLAFGLIFAVAGCAFAATYTKFSSKFIKHFEDCDKYEETVSSEFEGREFSTTRRIIGWKNGACKYQEIVSDSNGNYQLDCSFPSVQLDELYTSMKDRSKSVEQYELQLYGEQKNAKGPNKYAVVGSTLIRGNKAYITWARYQNNPYFCRVQRVSKQR